MPLVQNVGMGLCPWEGEEAVWKRGEGDRWAVGPSGRQR